MRKLSLLVAALALAISASAFAHDISAIVDADGESSAPNAMCGRGKDAHVVMTTLRPQTPQDLARAQDVLDTLGHALAPYRDYRVPLSQGYRIFLPTVPQEVYHFTDYAASQQEYMGNFDLAHPGSLLYVKRSGGDYVLVGAMYSAPPEDTQEQLDALIPLSVARWHQHVNICLPNGITLGDLMHGDVGAAHIDEPGMLPVSSSASAAGINQRMGFLADGRFGFTGSISDEATCDAAGGHLLKRAFGWMVHVYPFNGDDLKVAFGMTVPKAPAN
jgi:hypothetical protein